MKKLDYLYGKEIKLYQDDQMFKMNSDTRHLGEFLLFRKNNYTILDIGTNNGVLLLYANEVKKAKFYYGIDINEKALDLAKENMEINGINNYEFFACDLRDFKMAPLDYIVCNPPYFDGDNVSDNIDKTKARFAIYLPLDDLIKNAKRLLKERGSLFLVYPTFKLANVIATLDKYNFGVVRLRFVYDENKEESSVFLIEARREMKHYCKVDKPIVNTRKKW